MFKKLTALVVICAISLFGYGDTLWWLVNETATVDGQNLLSFIQPYAWEEDGYSGYDVGARVKVTFGDGTSTILPIYNNGQYWDYSSLDDSGDGRGVSTGNWASQSPLNHINSEMLTEALFQIELGNLKYDDLLDIFTWDEIIAYTDAVGKEMLSSYIWQGGVMPPADGQWTPTVFHAPVPEPTSSILCIIGFGVLMLKRKANG